MEPFEIDFVSPLDADLTDIIYTQGFSHIDISLPKKHRKLKTNRLLPNSKHFNPKQLLSRYLKPEARIACRRNPSWSLCAVIWRRVTSLAMANVALLVIQYYITRVVRKIFSQVCLLAGLSGLPGLSGRRTG